MSTIHTSNGSTSPLATATAQDDDEALTRAAESDPDSQPMTDDELRKMKPAAVMLPLIFGAEAAAEMLNPRQHSTPEQ